MRNTFRNTFTLSKPISHVSSSRASDTLAQYLASLDRVSKDTAQQLIEAVFVVYLPPSLHLDFCVGQYPLSYNALCTRMCQRARVSSRMFSEAYMGIYLMNHQLLVFSTLSFYLSVPVFYMHSMRVFTFETCVFTTQQNRVLRVTLWRREQTKTVRARPWLPSSPPF